MRSPPTGRRRAGDDVCVAGPVAGGGRPAGTSHRREAGDPTYLGSPSARQPDPHLSPLHDADAAVLGPYGRVLTACRGERTAPGLASAGGPGRVPGQRPGAALHRPGCDAGPEPRGRLRAGRSGARRAPKARRRPARSGGTPPGGPAAMDLRRRFGAVRLVVRAGGGHRPPRRRGYHRQCPRSTAVERPRPFGISTSGDRRGASQSPPPGPELSLPGPELSSPSSASSICSSASTRTAIMSSPSRASGWMRV
jgi:hypothetical protein